MAKINKKLLLLIAGTNQTSWYNGNPNLLFDPNF